MKRWLTSLATMAAQVMRGHDRAGFFSGRIICILCAPVACTSVSSVYRSNDEQRVGNLILLCRDPRESVAHRSLSTRGGGGDEEQSYEMRSHPAPGSPFHHAFPVHDLALAKEFYGNVLGCQEGRSSAKWQDYSLHGHQIVCHWVGNDYRCQDYYNPVDGDEVPVPHFGLALTLDQFQDLADRLRKAGVEFIIEPTLRFQGMPGEQYTMFFKDPSGNNLEFKAMTNPENLFAKYNVADS